MPQRFCSRDTLVGLVIRLSQQQQSWTCITSIMSFFIYYVLHFFLLSLDFLLKQKISTIIANAKTFREVVVSSVDAQRENCSRMHIVCACVCEWMRSWEDTWFVSWIECQTLRDHRVADWTFHFWWIQQVFDSLSRMNKNIHLLAKINARQCINDMFS